VKGTLYVVATPIGNLEDLGPRAARVLREAEVIVAEDTRVTAKLLAHLGLRKRLLSCYRENEAARVPEILAALAEGRSVALCTDAGSPGLSDPGPVVVAAAHRAGARVVPVPGPSAVAAALAGSGFDASRFRFAGFLARKGQERAQRLAEIAAADEPVVLFEAPGRAAETLRDLRNACGADREAVVAREITKIHEEVARGTLGELCQRFADEVRGEVTIVIGPAPPRPAREVGEAEIVRALAARPEAESLRDRVDAVAEALALPRRRVYAVAVRRRG
jgi:16S rRNA (cytidine1402-2'-O)-methyltransferase